MTTNPPPILSAKETKPLVKLKTNDGTKYLYFWFQLLGIVMPKRFKILYILYSFIVNLFSIILVPLSFTISYFTGTGKMNLSYFLTSLQIAVNIYACAVKFLIIVYMRRYLFQIEEMLEKLDARVNHPDEIREVEKNVKFGRRIVIFYFVSYFAYSTTTLGGALYMGRPPYSLYIPFLDWHNSKLNYFIVCILEFLLVDIACFQQVANDSYAVIYIRMVHTHLKILSMRVRRIGSDPMCTHKDNMEELKLCIIDHKNIIELVDQVAPVISPTTLVQFGVTIAALSTCLINIAITPDRSIMLGSAVFFCGINIEILPICYFVNCLVEQADGLPVAIFHMDWLGQSLQFRKALIFFIQRSQQTLVFYAGKVFPITLNSYVSILKLSFSMYTLLSAMDFGSRFD